MAVLMVKGLNYYNTRDNSIDHMIQDNETLIASLSIFEMIHIARLTIVVSICIILHLLNFSSRHL